MAEGFTALSGPLLLAVVAVGLTVESALLIGIVVPGTAITLAAGVAARAGLVPLPAATAGAAVGAVAGGQLAYHLGHRRRHQPQPFAGLTRLPGRPWTLLHHGLHQRPLVTIAAAQWLSSGRVLAPRAAGWAQSSYQRFTATHTPAAIAWATTLTGIGYTAGAAAREHLSLALGLAAGAAALAGLAGALLRPPTPAREAARNETDVE